MLFIAFSPFFSFSNIALGRSPTGAGVFPEPQHYTDSDVAKPRIENQWTLEPEISTDELLGLFFVILGLEGLPRSLSLYNLSLLTPWFAPLILHFHKDNQTSTLSPCHKQTRASPLSKLQNQGRELFGKVLYMTFTALSLICLKKM